MDASLWSMWNTAQPALAGLKAGEWALLIMLGATLLVLSALRERYLAIWTAGWALLVVSRVAGAHGAALRIPVQYVPAVEQATFVLAVAVFAGFRRCCPLNWFAELALRWFLRTQHRRRVQQ